MSGPSKATRSSVFAAVALAAFAAPASAQNVSAAPLAQVDPWGVGWLARADGPLPATFWAGSEGETLLPLMAELKPQGLAPAARQALRRIALSSARAPESSAREGGLDLIPERLRLIEQLGESDKSVDLRRRFAKAAWSAPADRIASDLELAQGRNETACARVNGKRADDPMWMPVRALCYAIARDFDQASLVAEQTKDAEGKPDTWLLSAVEAIRETPKTRPAGRYGAAFEAAVSVAAKLPVPSGAFAATPADVAQGVMRHAFATTEQKRAALRIAIDAGKATSADVLAVLTAPAEEAAAKPAAGQRAAPKPPPDLLALALAAAAKADAQPAAKSTAYAAALKFAETPTDARIASFALHDALKALPKSDVTLANAETFARAALLAGDAKLAQDWRKLMDAAPADKADAWAAARLDLMLSYAGGDASKSTQLLQRMMDALPAPPAADAKPAPAPKAGTPAAAAQRQLDLRRIENTRVHFLYVGSGRPLSGAARTYLAAQRTAGRGVPDAALARIEAALAAGANGEAAIAAIAQVGPDASAVSFSGLADLMTYLRRAGLDKDVDAIALEALQVWKAL